MSLVITAKGHQIEQVRRIYMLEAAPVETISGVKARGNPTQVSHNKTGIAEEQN